MSASDTRMAAASPCAARSTACPASGTAQPAEDGLVVAGLPVLVSDQVDAATLFWGIPKSHVVRELNRAAVADTARRAVTPPRGNRLMIRPERQVSDRLAHMAFEAGYPPGRVSTSRECHGTKRYGRRVLSDR
jgi:hypothetical protein